MYGFWMSIKNGMLFCYIMSIPNPSPQFTTKQPTKQHSLLTVEVVSSTTLECFV